MTHRNLLIALTSLTLMTSAVAQHAHPGHAGTAGHAHNPYSALQSRTIKALSDRDIADIRAGKGMSLALPAELNGYPGPSHVLELAGPLKLSEPQRARTEALFKQMQAEAIAAGEAWIEAEASLDQLFKGRQVTPDTLSRATARAASAHGRVRETHLRYHLMMMEVLSPEQVSQYKQLRGY